VLRCFLTNTLPGNSGMSKSVLVTGGEGISGATPARSFGRAGYRPVALTIWSRGASRGGCAGGPSSEGILARPRLLNRGACRASSVGGDALRGLRLCWRVGGRSGDLATRNNLGGTLSLLDAIARGRRRQDPSSPRLARPTALPTAYRSVKLRRSFRSTRMARPKLAIERALRCMARPMACARCRCATQRRRRRP